MDTFNTTVVALVIFSLLEILFFGGIQNGWVALVFILKQEGVFEHFCVLEDASMNSSTNSSEVIYNNIDCFRQDEQFNLIFSIGVAVLSSVTFLIGQLFMSFGITRLRILNMILAVAGIMCFSFTSPDVPWLPLPGIILVGVAGQALLISNYMQVIPLLPRGSSIYVGLINGCFDSSVVTLLIVKKLHEDGVDKQFSFTGIAIVFVAVSGICTQLHTTVQKRHVTDSDGKTIQITVKDKQETEAPNQAKEDTELVQHTTNNEDECAMTQRNLNPVGNSNASIGGMLCDQLYISHVVWLSIVLLKLFYFLGSANRLMGQILQDDSEVSYFTDVMTFTMLGSIVSSSIAGYTMQAMHQLFQGMLRTVIPLAMTSCFAILLSVLAFVPTPTALYVDFVVLTFLRSYVFCINIEYHWEAYKA